MCPQELLDISCKKIFELALVQWSYSQISRNLSSVLCSNVICGMYKACSTTNTSFWTRCNLFKKCVTFRSKNIHVFHKE